MTEEQRNLIVAIVLTMLVLIAYDYFFMPKPKPQPEGQAPQSEQATPAPTADGDMPAAAGSGRRALSLEEALAASPRVKIATPRLSGSVRLEGGFIDDLVLTDYRQDVDPDSPPVRLLSPVRTARAYYVGFGWAAAGGTKMATPGPDTLWQADGEVLTPERPLTLTWTNPQGVTFIRRITVDENYLFTITDTVKNPLDGPLVLAGYGLIQRHGTPKVQGYYILHEGPLGVFNDKLVEKSYKDLAEKGDFSDRTVSGWLGITDKYWLVALVPDQTVPFKGRFLRRGREGAPLYQTDFLTERTVVPAGGSKAVTTHLFAGAKEVHLIESYGERHHIKLFDRAIDWGWFIFLTKPIFYTLDWLYKQTGSFAIAILLLTVMVKLLFFPLANKSYHAMARMKAVQPKMKALQERYKDDRERLQREMMELYRKEKVNPAAGCLPVLVQIPVFFALYKVLFVTIEMRHQPGLFWVKDLSAPDHFTIVNLFGLIPWDPPSFLAIGLWPMLMALAMFLQQRLNPPAAEPVQQKIMMAMPFVFMFIMARFPAGLVMYWTWNTILSAIQQWVIMREDLKRNARARGTS